MWKKTATTANQHDRPQSSGPDEGSPKVMYNNGDGHSEILTPHVKYSPPFKRVKVVHEKSPMRIYADGFLEHLDHGCNSQSLTTKDVCLPSFTTLFDIYVTMHQCFQRFIICAVVASVHMDRPINCSKLPTWSSLPFTGQTAKLHQSGRKGDGLDHVLEQF